MNETVKYMLMHDKVYQQYNKWSKIRHKTYDIWMNLAYGKDFADKFKSAAIASK